MEQLFPLLACCSYRLCECFRLDIGRLLIFLYEFVLEYELWWHNFGCCNIRTVQPAVIVVNPSARADEFQIFLPWQSG